MDTIDNIENASRRRFLVSGASGLVLGFVLPQIAGISDAAAAGVETQVNSWLRIGVDNSITLTVGASDMGQGSFSGLAQILAEDLMVNYNRVITVQGSPTTVAQAAAPIGTSLNTVGSGITRGNYWKLRDASAAAREMLVQAAMNRLADATRVNYTVADGVITHTPSGTALLYGQVAADAALLAPVAGALVKDADFKVIGKTVARKDIPAKVDGSAIYGMDVRLPGMVYAAVKHCPTFGGKLAATPAKPSSVIAVVPLSVAAGTGRGTEVTGAFNAVAVVSTNTWDAWRLARSLKVTWTLPANAATLNDAQFIADGKLLALNATPYVAGGANPPGTLYTVEGDATAANAAIAGAAKTLDVMYTLPYVAHACMEVLSCTVDYVAGVKCDIYAPTQSGRGVLLLAMQLTGLTADKIKVVTTFLGGGLGRKAEHDFVSQAIQVGMAISRPVKLTWQREEDFTRDQYRPMAVVRARAGLDAGGNIAGWAYRNVSPSILGQRGSVLGAKGDSQGYESSQGLPYDIGARVTEWVSHPSPIPVGFWRSVGASINTFAIESMIDELAAAAGQDPYQYRRSKLTDPRWVAVLDAAATLGGWSTPLAAGRARGIAIGPAFNSIVAQVVEISGTATSIRVNRVSLAIDCYIGVNPGSIDAQLTGGIVHGLNAALYGRQSFVNGAAQAKNFNRSRMIRMGEMPQVEVKLIANPEVSDRATPLGGVGELGVPALAPALANAYARLTGTRVRTLPFFPNATSGG
jgi:isoquinoline 1-oxidoreductase subunit beta